MVRRSAKRGSRAGRAARGATAMVRAILGLLLLLGLASAALRPERAGGQLDLRDARRSAMGAVFRQLCPQCDDASVLSTITSRFGQTENTYWGGVHAIAGLRARPRDRLPLQRPLDYIPRRYCVARALMVDPRAPAAGNSRRCIRWSIRSRDRRGIIGMGWGVEWCVVGLDRDARLRAGLRRPAADHRAVDRRLVSQMARRLRPEGSLLSARRRA